MDEDLIIEGIVQLIKKAENSLPNNVINALKKAYSVEERIAKSQIGNILENISIAEKKTIRSFC
ncbi:MAG: fumarate hydratase [Candidatus Thermoplasmatota archaeon]